MKKWCIISILLVAISLPMVGCTSFDGNGWWQNNIPQLTADIHMFSKLATRIALTEAGMQAKDVELVKEYLVALQDILEVPGQPNFTGARILVKLKLPQKYQIYGLTIIDMIERYLQSTNLNITDDQELIISLISSGINGALVGVQEFA